MRKLLMLACVATATGFTSSPPAVRDEQGRLMTARKPPFQRKMRNSSPAATAAKAGDATGDIRRGDGQELAAAAQAAPVSRNWTKVLMADKPGAVCLDGSPGGFYIAPPAAHVLASAPTRWVVFHQGGGWCNSPTDCLKRSATRLGSSKQWPATYEDVYEGSKLWATPPFDEAYVVYAMYCDGGSWAGNATQTEGNTTLHYRGRALLDGLLDTLLGMGLGTAAELLYAGCSAGGLTAYLHTDYVRARIPRSVAMLGLADAMFALEHAPFDPTALDRKGRTPNFLSMMQWVYSAMNASASVNQACLAHYGQAAGWRCMVGALAARHVSTPMFILNSKYDTWQQGAIVGLPCVPPSCNSSDPPGAEAFWVQYGRDMVAALDKVPARHAAFLMNCPAHCQSGTGGNWGARRVGNTTNADAVSGWYRANIGQPAAKGEKAPRWVEWCDERPCAGDQC